MKTRRQRGGMNCVRGLCKRITNKVRSFLPKPEFPAYEKPTLDNQPPGIEFYDILWEYLQKFKLRPPKEIQEACNKIKRFIESTNPTDDIINDLGEIPFLNRENLTKEQSDEIFQQMQTLLAMIVTSPENDPQEMYFIGYEWAPQIKAKLLARSGLASAMIATGGNLGEIIPGGPGTEGVLARYLGGRERTNNVVGTTRRKRHSVTAKNQINNLKRIGTSFPGESVGEGRLMYRPNGIIQNSEIHL
jgi:hypothetical protein